MPSKRPCAMPSEKTSDPWRVARVAGCALAVGFFCNELVKSNEINWQSAPPVDKADGFASGAVTPGRVTFSDILIEPPPGHVGAEELEACNPVSRGWQLPGYSATTFAQLVGSAG